jgi:brefeldin A-resistance guanine nucleotide exchange factor 1
LVKEFIIKQFSLDLQDIDSNTFLTPFLDIICSDETSGPITCLALNVVNKFLSYGLIGMNSI